MRAMIFLFGLVLATPALALDDYDDCLALIASEPERARKEARAWATLEGGPAARHCLALALIETGDRSEAIDELIGIAVEEVSLESPARADILVQAGEMLVERDELLTATVVANQALGLAPKSLEALGLRAAIALAKDDYRAAFEDLERGLSGGRVNARLLLLRASAHRRTGSLIPARDDAVYATEIAPGSASAWLEGGRIEAALKDKPSARQSLLEAIDLDRDGPIGATARNVLQRMEAGLD